MEAIEAIMTRRSVRRYTGERVSDEDVSTMLKAAMFAPSAANQQAWHFYVITERSVLDAFPAINPYSSFIAKAPLAILVAGDLGLERFEGQFWFEDASAAAQNILLSAHALGLGAVWLAVYPLADRVKKTRELLALPEEIVPFCMISIGHPAEKHKQPDRFDPAKVTYV